MFKKKIFDSFYNLSGTKVKLFKWQFFSGVVSSRNGAPFLTWKLYEANSLKIWIKLKQIKINENQWRFLFLYI